jgi:LacI family transcriptional regulator
MAATIKDVAREADVSVASVSRVLNGHDNVTEATRDRVQAAIAKLHYVPNTGARSLITRRTDTVGVLLPDIYGEFFSEIVRGMDLAARSRGLHLLVSGSHGDPTEAAAAIRAMNGRVDGLLAMLPNSDWRVLADHLRQDMPTVLINTRDDSGLHASLAIDNYGGAYAMVRHLAERGHRRIALITGPEGNYDADERLRGYRQALAETAGTAEIILRGDFTEESGYRAGTRIASSPQLPDAVFACNDAMAIGCLFAFSEAGLKVPGDIALAGFDDIPIARFIAPPLTTVRVRIADLGGRALEQLATAIEHPDESAVTNQVLAAELVVRASCARPRKTARTR